MEDAHSFVYDYCGVRGQGYFAVFEYAQDRCRDPRSRIVLTRLAVTRASTLPNGADRTSTRSVQTYLSSEHVWLGLTNQYLLDATLAHPEQYIPDLLNKTFQVVDSRLSHLAQAGKTSSGCTAVTAFLRVEQDLKEEPRGFSNPGLSQRGLMEGKGEDELEAQTSLNQRSRESSIGGGTSGTIGGAGDPGSGGSGLGRKMSGRRIRDFVKGLTSSGNNDDEAIDESTSITAHDGSRIEAIEPSSDKPLKRVLYTANVGDARAVLRYGVPSDFFVPVDHC